MADLRSVLVTQELHEYAVEHGLPPDEVQRSLIEATAQLGPASGMQISPIEGAFLTILTKIVGVTFAVEVGTFTGYSSISIARGLADGGRLLCCDVSEDWTAIAREHWKRAGLDDRIELRIAPAIETLRALPDDPPIDLAFIDADKTAYVEYYEEIVPRLRTGGVVVLDNTLWSGRVVDADNDDESTVAIRTINDRVAADDRVEVVVLPLDDGVTIARKR